MCGAFSRASGGWWFLARLSARLVVFRGKAANPSESCRAVGGHQLDELVVPAGGQHSHTNACIIHELTQDVTASKKRRACRL
jgi:uncharacterized phage protein gp47/JayE